ncbi:MAG: HTH-type transcriptional activator RhaS [Burkholderia lata]|uniref:HTH-type transcriptional activator RhaS n=1 Tax=Burkholderia lata (strain ATCC 17760 / DSM 23089 / LMG 22485 / NCIMB 9086 / R18194 / 383) TaxID=482957 RepID=A0A833PMI8_BURL3|nr:MAG: HTH-type transcriptional activator RhaS [Burkholderia lata]
MKLFRETTSHTLRQGCEVRGDAYWFGIPATPDGSARIDARPIVADGFACRPGNVEFELLTPTAFSIYGVVVRGDVLRRYAEQVEHAGFDARLQRQSQGQPRERRRARRCPAANATICRRTCWPRCSTRARAGPDDGDEAHGLHHPQRRRRIVALARDYVLAHRSRSIGVPELCEQLHVSRRTLQNCFQDVLGMAPATYLRALRLNGARRDLCDRAAGSVQDVAAAWGFWHLSQFATDYRRMFGMRPSEALRDATETAEADTVEAAETADAVG